MCSWQRLLFSEERRGEGEDQEARRVRSDRVSTTSAAGEQVQLDVTEDRGQMTVISVDKHLLSYHKGYVSVGERFIFLHI